MAIVKAAAAAAAVASPSDLSLHIHWCSVLTSTVAHAMMHMSRDDMPIDCLGIDAKTLLVLDAVWFARSVRQEPRCCCWGCQRGGDDDHNSVQSFLFSFDHARTLGTLPMGAGVN
jgi:hypothetical protein